MSLKNTNISWITIPRKGENEWCEFQKIFFVEKEVDKSIIRFESDCVCAVYLNGEFIISGTGRYPERVNCHEVTSKLHQGENVLQIILGGHYFQAFGRETKEHRGYWLNQAALELEMCFADGDRKCIPTDNSWINVNCSEEAAILETMQVTRQEYETMWKNAALWQENRFYKPDIADAVLRVTGNSYRNYANEKQGETISCDNIISTNMQCKNGVFYTKDGNDESYLIVDMGRLVVGYMEFEYQATGSVTVTSLFDVTEQLEDFTLNTSAAKKMKRLSTVDALTKTQNSYRNLRRRAFRYIKLIFKGDLDTFSFSALRVRLCMFPETVKGWFRCSDEQLNKMWETGKYTLHVNKQQEYESCPRCEMLFFAGDGAVDALVDIYAFGDCSMLNTSLSIKHEESANGTSNKQKFNRTVWQWDYFAWRIICIYNYYRHTGEKAFLERHYEEAVNNILWLIERMNNRELLFQIPAFLSTFSSSLIQVDWACSIDRLGENVFLNCLLYKSLICMHELACDMDDERSEEWERLACRVKEAINTYLWNEDKQAYIDSLGEGICQDSNVLAVMFGVAENERAQSVLSTLKSELWSEHGSAMANVKFENRILRGGNATISPMMSAREAEAWFMQGKAEDALELIRRVWGSMLQKGATTFWEFNPNNKESTSENRCHAWSTGCTYLLSAYILGVRPATFNWETIYFAPRPCDLAWGKGVVPTPHGLIAVSWEKSADGVSEYNIALPKQIEMSIDIPDGDTIKVIKY